MRLHMAHFDTFCACYSPKCPHLVQEYVDYFFAGKREWPPPKAPQVWIPGMCPYCYTVFPGKANRYAHYVGVSRVCSTGYVGGCDKRHYARVIAELTSPEALAHIAIQVNVGHSSSPG